MLVNLKRDWFDPDGNKRSVRDNPHDIPDIHKDKLPSTAEVLPKKEEAAIKKAEKEEEKK